jgi:regulator of nucleoside diphosphate kinase
MSTLPQNPLLTEFDSRRLRSLLQVLRERSGMDARKLGALESELDRARIVAPDQVPPGVITMNSRLRMLDLDSGEELTVVLVFPGVPANEGTGVPVLSALGMALLGGREGDTVHWHTPAGARRAIVEQLLYQPEAAGHFLL